MISQKRDNWIYNETLENTPRSSNPDARQFETLTENTNNLQTIEPYECKVRLKKDQSKITVPKKLNKKHVTQRSMNPETAYRASEDFNASLA